MINNKNIDTTELKQSLRRMYNDKFYSFLLKEKVVDNRYDITVIFYHFFASTVFDGEPYFYYFTCEETTDEKHRLMDQYLDEYIAKCHFPNETVDYGE